MTKTSVEEVASKDAADPLCELYEQLRSYVLAACDVPGQVYGLGVMLQRGMGAWIKAASEYVHREAADGNVDSQQVIGTLSPVQTELARLLAGIVLKHNQKEVF